MSNPLNADPVFRGFDSTPEAEALVTSVYEALRLFGPSTFLQAEQYPCGCVTVRVLIHDQSVFTGGGCCGTGDACGASAFWEEVPIDESDDDDDEQ